MVENGIVTSNSYEQRHILFEWRILNQSIETNQTTIEWKLKGGGGNEYTWYMSGNFKVVVDNTTLYQSATRIKLYKDQTVIGGRHTITHQHDGSKSFHVNIEAGIYAYAVNCRGSGNFALPNIARASTPTLNKTSMVYDEVVTVHFNRASNAFTHTLQVGVDGRLNWTHIGTNLANSFEWRVPKSWSKHLPNASDRVKFRLLTYHGNQLIGTKEAAIRLQLQPTSDMAPVVTITLTDSRNFYQIYGGFVRGQSKIKAVVSERLYTSTTVASCKLLLNGIHYTSCEATSEIINTTEQSITASVTDARGIVGNATQRPIVYDWYYPRIPTFNCHRCNAQGGVDDTGGYIRLNYSVDIASVNNRNQKNIRYGYKKQSENNWTFQTIDSNSFTKTGHVIISASGEFSWDVKIEVSDAFATSSLEEKIGTAFVLVDFHRLGKGIGVGKVSENERMLDLASDWQLKYKNAVMHDFVVASGYTNDWYWRKWNNGFAECYRKFPVTVNVKGNWGGFFVSDPVIQSNLAYPFAFMDVPVVNVSLVSNGWAGILMASGGSYRPTRTHTGTVTIMRGAVADNATYYINYHVIGKWKN